MNEKLAELKRRLLSLKKSPMLAKPAAAEEALICAVEVLDEMESRVAALAYELESVKLEIDMREC